jgi:hypothetical protein
MDKLPAIDALALSHVSGGLHPAFERDILLFMQQQGRPKPIQPTPAPAPAK